MKFYRAISLLLLLLTVQGAAYSNEPANEQTMFINYNIYSEILGEERAIEVHLPQGYNSANKLYPVLYILDGQRWFLYGAELQNIFSEYEYTPEFIVVGVKNVYPDRFANFSSNSTKFRQFLKNDIINFVDKSYRTSNERMLFGWELGGGFVIETLYEHSQLFNGYFASSPYPVDEKTTQAFKALFSNKPALSKTFVFAEGEKESQQYLAHRLKDFLTENSPKPFKWTFQELNREKTPILAHRMSPFDTLYIGLREYFHDYPSLEFASSAQYTEFGGMQKIKKYYKDRAKKYQLDESIPFSGMFSLLKLAMSEDELALFDELFQSFKNNGLIENTNIGWGTRYAKFYQKHKEYKKSVDAYQLLLTKFPDNPRLLNGAAHSLLAIEKYKEAETYLKKAVEVAETQDKKNLSKYKKNLNDYLKVKME